MKRDIERDIWCEMWYSTKIKIKGAVKYGAYQVLLVLIIGSAVCNWQYLLMVCGCVCVYILPPWRLLPSARCLQHTWWPGSTIMCCEYYSGCFCQVHLSRYLKMSYFTSKDENSSQTQNWRENDMIYWRPAKRWYILT